MSVFYALYLLILDMRLGISYLLFLAIYLILAEKFAVHNRNGVKDALEATANVSTAMADCFINVEAVMAGQAQNFEAERLNDHLDFEESKYFAVQSQNNRTAFIQQVLVVLFAVILLLFSGQAGLNIAVENTLLILLYSVINLTGFGAQYLSIREMFDRLRAGLTALEYEVEEPIIESRSFDSSSEGLILEKISFSYDGSKVFADKSLLFKKNQINALVGPNGSGKSTLLKICSGLLNQSSGSVVLPCDSPNDVMYISQHSALFNRSIYENICYGNTCSLELIMTFVRELGLDTVIPCTEDLMRLTPGDLSDQFSGGEIQKILAIRAFISKPRVLLCDEITSGMDTPSVANFYLLLKEYLPDTTCVCVTHRPEDLGYCDFVVEV